jgi:hypothetical protein
MDSEALCVFNVMNKIKWFSSSTSVRRGIQKIYGSLLELRLLSKLKGVFLVVRIMLDWTRKLNPVLIKTQ